MAKRTGTDKFLVDNAHAQARGNDRDGERNFPIKHFRRENDTALPISTPS